MYQVQREGSVENLKTTIVDYFPFQVLFLRSFRDAVHFIKDIQAYSIKPHDIFQENYIHFLSMEEWSEVHTSLVSLKYLVNAGGWV